jgi:hypothetical protein
MATLALFSEAIGNETVNYEERSHGGNLTTTHESRLGIRLVAPDVLRRSAQPVLLYADRPVGVSKVRSCRFIALDDISDAWCESPTTR